MSAKSLKFFGPPTTKWRPCKIFAKLNGNHLLMANIFKLHEYQTFGLMKMHNIYKIWFASNIFSLVRWNKMYFHDFSSIMKILAIKRWFPFNFAKVLLDHHFVVGAAFKILYCRAYCCFCMLAIKLI